MQSRTSTWNRWELIDPSEVVEACVAERDLMRLAEGTAARFLPVNGDSLTLRVVAIAHTSTPHRREVIQIAGFIFRPVACVIAFPLRVRATRPSVL